MQGSESHIAGVVWSVDNGTLHRRANGLTGCPWPSSVSGKKCSPIAVIAMGSFFDKSCRVNATFSQVQTSESPSKPSSARSSFSRSSQSPRGSSSGQLRGLSRDSESSVMGNGSSPFKCSLLVKRKKISPTEKSEAYTFARTSTKRMVLVGLAFHGFVCENPSK